jgi:FkbM family methyltransferase
MSAGPRPALRLRVFAALDRRLDRRIVAGLGAVYLSARSRGRCAVRYEDGQWVHRYRDGVVVNRALGGPWAALQDRIGSDTFLYGYTPGPGDTVLDLGAGVGGEVRLFSRLVGPAGRVICVEAHPATFECLLRTVALNRLPNVTALQCAATGTAGMFHLADDPVRHAHNSLTEHPGGVEVTGRPLAELVRLTRVDRIDLLKMNIEGAELPVLASAGDTLGLVDNLVVSCHDFLADAGGDPALRTFAPVTALLRDAGFVLRTRPRDRRPWIPYYVYASRPAFPSRRR